MLRILLIKYNLLFIKLAVFFLPISLFIAIGNGGTETIANFKIGLSEIFISASSCVFIIQFLLKHKPIKLSPPPFVYSAFLIAITISVVNAESIASYVKEIVQLSLSFYIWYIILHNTRFNKKKAHSILTILVISCWCLIPFAIYQLMVDKQTPYFIRSVFVNRNIYCFFMALCIPLVFSMAINARRKIIKSLHYSLIILSLTTMMAFGHVIASFIGILTVAVHHSKKSLLLSLGGVLIYLVTILTFAPAKYQKELKSFVNIYESNDIKSGIEQVWAYNSASQSYKNINIPFFENNISISNPLFMPHEVTHTSVEILRDKKHEQGNLIKQYYAEWIAGIQLLNKFTFSGCGIGNYQNNIGSYYGHLEKNNTSEPNYHNGYIVIAASTGLLGIATFLFMFYSPIAKIRRSLKSSSHLNEKTIQIGLLGSIAAILVSNFFTPVWSAPILTTVVFILFLSDYFSNPQNENKENTPNC